MKRLRLVAVGALIVTFIGAPLAYAAGLWWGLPIIGEAAYCTSYSGYPTTATVPGTLPTPNNCNTTAPAGPADLTGNELYPVDIPTNNNVGPTTVYVPAASAGSGVPDYVANTSIQSAALQGTGTFAIPNNVNNVILNPTSTLSALTVTLPASPLDGQIVRIGSSQQVTPTLVITATSAATTVKNAPTSLTSLPYDATFIYNLSQNTWFRF